MSINPFLNGIENLEYSLGELEEGFLPIYDYYKTRSHSIFNHRVEKLFSLTENYTIDDVMNISYKFNNFGFRSNFDYTFEESDQIWIFGDSNTVGIGNSYENVWINRLPDEYGTVYNISFSGTSVDTAVRYLKTSLEITKHKPKLIAVCGFFKERKEFFVDGIWKAMNLGHIHRTDFLKDISTDLTVIKASQILIEAIRQYDSLKNEFISIANEQNIPLVWPDRYENWALNTPDYGRDVGDSDFLFQTLLNSPENIDTAIHSHRPHGGPMTQKYYYNLMKTLIEEKLK